MTSCYVTLWHTLDTLHLTSSQKAERPENAIVLSKPSTNVIFLFLREEHILQIPCGLLNEKDMSNAMFTKLRI